MALNASQRISLIKEISERLANEDWPLIDVTLKQFGLPIKDEWRGTKESYVLHLIEAGADTVLLELARHVGFQLQTAPPGVEPPFWRKDMLKVFVSHLSAYCKFAGELQEKLLDFGISAFVAHNDIEPTAEWQTQIETALATCDALVSLLHEDFHLSNWTDQEIGFAMGRGVPVFSVKFDQDPYGFIGRFQAFNGTGKSPTSLARELFEAYRRNKQTQPQMAEVLIRLLEGSGSFAAAKMHMDYLEELEAWEPEFSARLMEAVKNNSQVSHSWDVPERINVLINKWASRGI